MRQDQIMQIMQALGRAPQGNMQNNMQGGQPYMSQMRNRMGPPQNQPGITGMPQQVGAPQNQPAITGAPQQVGMPQNRPAITGMPQQVGAPMQPQGQAKGMGGMGGGVARRRPGFGGMGRMFGGK